ncbi:lipopolysaccharide biosynthesis protein [Citrobacter amalonaticus]|jgi:O-antigen/teichoic acid export membrane protein|uniref:lipopolysaccharide biosynthesis protein n=1 Tax=Citrobacter amalonaticus TaxID=35703 RepID=UPI002297B0F7|nr:lipopolysaccharide biosynthesis protein [Citrobacter amalonaticus]
MKTQSVKSGFVWSAIDRIFTQVVQLAIMLVLARRLGPEAFGLIGMLAVFIAISQVFVDSGFSSAIIRKTDRNESDYSTVFIFNGVIALICYGILWTAAPLISEFYDKPELTSLMRWLGLVVPINSLGVVQRVRLSVLLNFKAQAKASITAASISGACAIFLAYFFDFGVWALVSQTLLLSIINVLILNLLNPWIPKTGFSVDSFKTLFNFGYKLLLSSLLESIYANIYPLIIGKWYDATKLGFYTQANQLSSVPAMTMTNIIQRVSYPLLSNIQNNVEELERKYLVIIRLSCLIVFPVMASLAIIATPLLTFLVGEQWRSAGILVSVLCTGYLLYPLHAINLNLLQVKGRSDLFLKLEIVKKIINTIILLVSLPYGVTALCYGIAINSYFALLINSYYTGKLSSIGLKVQVKTIFPSWMICFSFIMLLVFFNSASLTVMKNVTILLAFLFSYTTYLIIYQKENIKAIMALKKQRF